MITLGNQYGDYRCEKDKINLDLISSLFYFGGVAGCLFLALLGNFMGRKKLLIFLMGILIFGLGVACISKNLLTAGIGLFLICMGVQSAYTLSFLFLA
jgi:MFS family permease